MKNRIFKGFISLLLGAVMILSAGTVVSATTLSGAGDYQLNYVLASSASTQLSISGTTATCFTTAYGNSTVTSISATQTLEKHWGLWIWSYIGSWSKTSSSRFFNLSATSSGLTGGTYRVRTDVTLTSSNGTTETITVYSTEVTI